MGSGILHSDLDYMGLITQSGGIVYHLRALRHRDGAWLPFRRAVSDWLAQQLPSADELLLVGPSGGHCLPLEQLRRFGRLSALEPDPLARVILEARLGRSLESEARDLILRPLLEGRAGLDAVLERRPRAAVLFCNVLGQLQHGLDDEQGERFQREFRRRLLPALQGRPWASFHDRWSFDLADGEPLPSSLAFDRSPSDTELATAWFGETGPRLEAFDHGTSELFPPELPRRYFGWQLTPSAFFLVEGVAGPALP